MEIDQLPTEILMEIFSYVPTYENLALVSSQFYSVVCSIRDSKTCLRLRSSDFDSKNNAKLKTIMCTTRKITKIALNIHRENVTFKLVIDLIEKFSTDIIYMKLSGHLKIYDFLKILACVPNVSHLDLYHVKCSEYHLPPRSDELKLQHLNTLTVSNCSDDIMLQFNRLPGDVALSLEYQNVDDLTELFKMQTKMKQLTVNSKLRRGTLYNADLLDGLRLESLKWIAYSFNDKNFPKILSKQTKLKSLQLISGDVNEDTMNAITTQLTELQRLTLNIGDISVNAFRKIKKLEMVKQLKLVSSKHDLSQVAHFKTFASIDNSRITSLVIHCVYELSKDLIASLARSAPNLKTVRFICDYSNDTLYAIMKYFNFVEVLQMDSIRNNIEEGNMEVLSDASCANKQLKELRIYGEVPFNAVLLETLIKHYLNLHKLILRLKTDFAAEQFKRMLIGFEKLESMSLHTSGELQLEIDDLYLLREYRNNLKFIALNYLKIRFTREVKKNLKEIFDFVSISQLSYEDYACIKMATSRKTMENECI